MNRLPILISLAVLALLAGCGGDDDKGTTASGQKIDGCTTVDQPDAKDDGGQKPPTKPLDPAKTYDVTFTTNCGSFTVRIDQKKSPRTAASFVGLAQDKFFDDTTFHRIVPGFVIQGGDPTATGNGGPGYSTRDVPPAGTRYTRGVVAMAKTASEAPGTAGSQFFVVSGNTGLPADYAVLGKVTKGMATVDRISTQGDPNSGGEGVPLRPVVTEKATVSES